MLFTDSVAISGSRITRDGYMVVDARIARTGIQVYHGSELGRSDLDTVRVYRPEGEVFSDRAMGSFAHRPVTDDHPAEMVGASNWRDHTVGMTGDVVTRDGEHVRVPFTLMDGATIETVQSGKRELSAGYTAGIDWTAGTTTSGEQYDAVMTDITGNHLAIVSRGRAGATCRIGDSWASTSTPKEPPRMADQTRPVVHDGVTYNVSDQGAQLIERLQTQLTDAARSVTSRDGQISALTAANQSAINAKDGELAALRATHTTAIEAKDGEIAALNARIADTAAIDAMIAAREGTIAGARRILGDSFDPKGKTDAAIRREAVVKQLGDALVAGKSDDYVGAAFDTLTAAPVADPLRDIVRDGLTVPVAVGDKKASTYEERQANRWKGSK